jgi:hypothetical protein
MALHLNPKENHQVFEGLSPMCKAHTSMFGCCTSTVFVVLVFIVNKIILICVCMYVYI